MADRVLAAGPKLLVAALAPAVGVVALALALVGIVARLPLVGVPAGWQPQWQVRSGAAAGEAVGQQPQEQVPRRRDGRRPDPAAQLAGEGHTVLDVAYRLFPETDIPGMVQDALRAVAWLRAHVSAGGRPATLVVAGGSAGGHLALLAADARHDERFRPPELNTSEVEVQGVVSMYGPADLAAMYHHTRQDRLPLELQPPSFHGTVPDWARRLFGVRVERLGFERLEVAGRLDWLVGGRPDAVPERYAWLSPLEHVHEGCPPTLLVHGTHDAVAPVTATQLLQQRLVGSGVAVTALYLPHTDHGFDLVLPRWSPATRAALRELQRFLAAVPNQPHPAT